jgi:hypothetical protein
VSETMVGSAGLTVSALARRVGVDAHTVRYYERARLLAPPELTAANYRMWSSQYVLHGRKRKNSFGKAHVLPCVPNLIQLQKPCTAAASCRGAAQPPGNLGPILDLPSALINQRH